MLVTFLVSCTPKTNENTAKNVEIKVGETYLYNDAEDWDVDYSRKASSDDEDVAYVLGKYICANKVGKTKVTVDKGNSEDVYNVTVKASELGDRLPTGVTDIRDKTVYPGSGFNAIKCSGLVTADDLLVGNSIINPNMISPMNMSADGTPIDKFLFITGTTQKQYDDSHNNEINGALNVNIKDIVKGQAEGKFVDSKAKSGDNYKMFTTVFSYSQRYKYKLTPPTRGFREMPKPNKEARKDLTSVKSKDDCLAVFEKYGTHIITASVVGGRMESDYLITQNKNVTNEQDFLKIAGELKLTLAVVQGEASASYSQEPVKKIAEYGYSVKLSVKTCGGTSAGGSLITDIGQFAKAYPVWNTLSGSQAEQLLSFIGTTAEGSLPI